MVKTELMVQQNSKTDMKNTFHFMNKGYNPNTYSAQTQYLTAEVYSLWHN
jgi:hypothetical protein